MKNITFGYLLEKLLYISKQKKSSLAKMLGYDISYISKWTSGKNLPIHKNIQEICLNISKFIVNSLTEETKKDIKEYFDIDNNISSKEDLINALEELLKESYMYTSQRNIPIQSKNVYWEDDCNATIHINPKLRKYYLNKDIDNYISSSNNLDLILNANLKKINKDDKISIADIKGDLFKRKDEVDLKVRVLLDFDKDYQDIIFNTIMIINMIAMCPSMDFTLYNCDVGSNDIISIVKDRVLYTSNFTKDKKCLISTMSKDKDIIDEIYYSLETILKNQGSLLVENKTSIELIKEQLYTQYLMSQDLRWLMGSINELFMPSKLFIEIANSLFSDSKILQEIEKINIVLQNITYKSKIKVLLYVSEIKRYISSGEINFLNNPIKLSFEQRKKHINYLKDIINNNDNIEIKLVSGDFVEYFKNYPNPCLYLSKSIKLIQTNHDDGVSDYAFIKDKGFTNMCDEFYKTVWEEPNDIIISDKDEILDILEKELTYASILNENLICKE